MDVVEISIPYLTVPQQGVTRTGTPLVEVIIITDDATVMGSPIAFVVNA